MKASTKSSNQSRPTPSADVETFNIISTSHLPNKKHGLLPFASEDDSIYMKYWRTGGGG
jgi:hypothetical protein